MKKVLLACVALGLMASTASATIIATDPAGDEFSFNGNMDLIQLEANSNATDLVLTLSINGDIAAANWGKYLFFIDTDNVAGSGGASQFPTDPPTNDGNPWIRNIAIGDTNHLAEYFIGSWVDAGGGTQLFGFGGGVWTQSASTPTQVITPGAISTVSYTIALSDLGVGVGDTIFLEGFSSGGGNFDTANDTVNSPSDDWNAAGWQDQALVANSTPYTIVPEPASLVLFGLGGLVLLRRRR